MSTILTHTFTDAPIKNFTFEQFFETFGCNQLDVSSFWLMNVGFTQEERKYAHVILRACQIRPLFGPHLVSVFYKSEQGESEMKTFWVHSLTYLRRNLFHFEDRLSFERSTYLIPYENGSLLIRLKSIRAFLILPLASPNSPLEPIVRMEPKEVEESECTDKMRLLLNHHIQCMISYVNREMQTTSDKTIPFLEMYIQHYCQELKIKINKDSN